MIWPFRALAPAKERLSFQTDVMQTRVTERRVSLRPARVVFEYQHYLDEAQDAKAVALFRSNPAGDWSVPQWTGHTEYAAPVAAGATSLPVDINADWRVGGSAYVVGAGDAGEALEITAVGADTITLAGATTVDAIGVAPLRTAYMQGGLGGARLFRGLTIRDCKFITRDGVDLGATPYPQLAGLDVMNDPTVVSTPVQDAIFKALEYVDNGSGLVSVEPVRDIIEGRVELRFIDTTTAELWTRKKWFHHIRGREKAFWVPSWTADFTLAAPITAAATLIQVEPLAGLPTDYVGRAIMIDDGSPLYRIIGGASDLGATWSFSIDPTGRDIDAARISRMPKYRLDTDEVEFSQTLRAYGDVSVVCLEVQE